MSRSSGKLAGVSLVVILILALGGCGGSRVIGNEPVKQQAGAANAVQEKAVLDRFNELRQNKDVELPELLRYVDANIAGVSTGGAATMVIGLEKVQQERLPAFQDGIGDNQDLQIVLAKSYRGGMTPEAIDNIENKEVKALLLKTKASGFKIETAEGMFFPVIDYSAYKKYRDAVTPDIAAYIDIMAVESDKTPIKDAALVISWSEILKRATVQERFILDYGTSTQSEAMRQLLQRYTMFALYGANNTPLFSYDNRVMSSEAKKAYLETSFEVKNGNFSKIMSGYLAVLQKNDYRLTAEVQEYRNKAAAEIR